MPTPTLAHSPESDATSTCLIIPYRTTYEYMLVGYNIQYSPLAQLGYHAWHHCIRQAPSKPAAGIADVVVAGVPEPPPSSLGPPFQLRYTMLFAIIQLDDFLPTLTHLGGYIVCTTHGCGYRSEHSIPAEKPVPVERVWEWVRLLVPGGLPVQFPRPQHHITT
ncbi:hypothetical protein M405DRAFT_841478 [Rhizopogon salebrosus TDB-379]|nr:hypothetical protein M405DRAFT_841478 [Rhizopogon salebrosus TDB-379]